VERRRYPLKKAVMTSSIESLRRELGSAMATAQPGLPAANQLCVACVDLLGVDGAAISVVYDGASQGTFGANSEMSRRLDEYQFTFGEGPCLDATATRSAVLAPDLDSPHEKRWPGFSGAVLGEGIRAVFALPIHVTSVSVGALDLYRHRAGPLSEDHMAGGLLAAQLATLPLLELISGSPTEGVDNGSDEDGWERLADIDRVEIHQATGMLIAELDVDAPDALVRLRAHAIATGQSASEVAWAIIERRLVLERDTHGRGGGGGHP
jgi:hypothetical protein